MKLLIIQPWLGAPGHPAQSLINTASAIGRDARVEYLVSMNKDSTLCSTTIDQLQRFGRVHVFAVDTFVGVRNTSRAFFALVRLMVTGHRYNRVFFFDSSLSAIARLWPLFALLFSGVRISVLQLFGPEHITRDSGDLRRVSRLLKRPDVKLYVRTDELAQSWNKSFEQSLGGEKIGVLPSLEIPDDEFEPGSKSSDPVLKVGIIGQIRPNKGIEWLVPLFKNNPGLGQLTVAGEFNKPETKSKLTALADYPGFINRFLSEKEMLELAAAQAYLLMLYHPWDRRMESGILYLAARVCRPVVVYGDSWSGRMVMKFGCGVTVPPDREAAIAVLQSLPHPNTSGYSQLADGMKRFKLAHSNAALRSIVLEKFFGSPSALD